MKLRYLFLSLLCFFSITAYTQTADFTFTSSNNSFCAPQTVTFTQAATGNPASYLWDFGDGQAGVAPVENHLYEYPGTYTVTFTAVYANSAASVTKTITINPTPQVTLSANRTSLCQPGAVVFTAAVTGNASSYEWAFGDGSTQTTTTNTVTHPFAAYGTFNTTVKAISPLGCSSSSGITIQIARFPISVSISPDNGCLPANATFTATTTFPPGDGLQSILWTFGDGTPDFTGNTNSTTHTYNTTNNIFTAGVQITSNQGCTNQYTLDTFAFGIPPINTTAYTTALRDTFCGSETIGFYGFADSANYYTWNFGDGTTETTKNTGITHKYSTLGDQSVSVTPYYNGCAGPVSVLNIFITGVIADYTYSNTCSDKKTFSFLNQSLGNISNYQWTFTDAPGFVESANYNPSHTFPAVATSDVKLLVIDNVTGCRDSLISTIYTADPVFIADKAAVCRDSSINYVVNGPYPAGTGYSYELHINGNIINLGGSTGYEYRPRNYGNFQDYVVIKDTLTGTCNDTLYISSQIKVMGPVVSFSNQFNICIDTSATFTNNSYPFFPQDNIVKWLWDYADGQKDTVQNPNPHKYAIPGQRIVSLTATDINGCAQKYEGGVNMNGLPSISVFPAIDTLCLGETAMLRAYALDTIIWTPVNNIDCASCDTVYVNPGITTNYIATTISHNGCKNSDTAIVKVFAPINLNITSSSPTVCPGTPVQLDLNAGGNITWSPPYFLNSTTIKNPVSTPDSSITYTVILKDSVGCFADTAFTTINVYPIPSVDAGPDLTVPYNNTFTLTPVYSSSISSYLWSPGENLSCTTCANPVATALKRKTYTIEVTDNNNCKASDSVQIFVTCEKSNLILPNAFTPNGDRLNDNFYPIAYGYNSIKSFSIFNRNGFKVFERKNFQPNIASMGWDGRIKNDIGGNTQAFVYVIEAECDSGAIIVSKGTVMLIR